MLAVWIRLGCFTQLKTVQICWKSITIPVHVPRTDTNTETMSNKSNFCIFLIFSTYLRGQQNFLGTSDKGSIIFGWLEKRKVKKMMRRLKCNPRSRHKGADCNLRQGARHLTGTYKGNLFPYFLLVVYFVWISVSFVGSKLCFLSFSMQSHSESFRNLIKQSVFDHLSFK